MTDVYPDVVNPPDSVFEEMATTTERYLWGLPRLSLREKALVTLVADVCNQTLGPTFEQHVAVALNNNVSFKQLRALLRCVAFEAGYPAAAAAMSWLLMIERGTNESPTAAASGPAAASMPPANVVGMWDAVDEGFGDFMRLQAELVGRETALGARDRAFVAITCDVLYQTLQDTFRLHISRALTAGADPEDIRNLLRFCAQFGVTRVWNAFTAFDRHLGEIVPTASTNV